MPATSILQIQTVQLEHLVDDVELRRAAAKTLKGFCLTHLPHHFPAALSDFFYEMAGALQDHDTKHLEIIGFRGCAKSRIASLALVLWAALEHPDRDPFITLPANTAALRQEWPYRVKHECSLSRWTGAPSPTPKSRVRATARHQSRGGCKGNAVPSAGVFFTEGKTMADNKERSCPES